MDLISIRGVAIRLLGFLSIMHEWDANQPLPPKKKLNFMPRFSKREKNLIGANHQNASISGAIQICAVWTSCPRMLFFRFSFFFQMMFFSPLQPQR